MTQTAIQNTDSTAALESALITGDLSNMTPEDRLIYYKRTCESLGLNPLTKPFEYVKLNNKLTLYARKDATDQLRKLNAISIDEPKIQFESDWIIVTVLARTPEGRTDSDIGVVNKKDMQGNFGNALMKAVTKSKRRVTLSICGLGFLDETEVEAIPTAEIITEPPSAKSLGKPPARNEYEAAITALCQALNKSGDSINWTKATLTEYINELFSVEDGMDALSNESFEMLVGDLRGRLESLTNEAK